MLVSSPAKVPVASLAALVLAVAAFFSPSSFSSWSALAQDAENTDVDEFVVVDVPPDKGEDILTVTTVTGVDASVCAADSRSFRADIATVCSGGAYGYKLEYRMGAVRGDIVVASCPVDDVVTFRTVGGTAGSMPFAAEEIDFLDKIATDIEANPTDNLEEPGSLEALAVTTSRTLAAWPSGQFPISFTYTASDVASGTYSVKVPIVADDATLAIPTSVMDDNDDDGTPDNAFGVSVPPQLANVDNTPIPDNFVISTFGQLAPDLADTSCTLANVAFDASQISCDVSIYIICATRKFSTCSRANTASGKRPNLNFRVFVENKSSPRTGGIIRLTSNVQAKITWTNRKGVISSTDIDLSHKLNTNTLIASGVTNAQHSHQLRVKLKPEHKGSTLTVSTSVSAKFKNSGGGCFDTGGLDLHF